MPDNNVDNEEVFDWSYFDDFVEQYTAIYGALKDFHTRSNYFQQLSDLRKFYNINEQAIISCTLNTNGWFSSNFVNWHEFMTPIEFAAWQSIRAKGRPILYPQYPALNYYLDFGDPAQKIGLELDGKKFHDRGKDLIRDNELRKEDWTIYRITGSEMMRNNYKDIYDVGEQDLDERDWNSLKDWICGSGDGVIEAIKVVHFKGITGTEDNERFYNLCVSSLETHQLFK